MRPRRSQKIFRFGRPSLAPGVPGGDEASLYCEHYQEIVFIRSARTRGGGIRPPDPRLVRDRAFFAHVLSNKNAHVELNLPGANVREIIFAEKI